jgi:uncharacterized protein
MIFEWDEAKAASNVHKHGIAFERAVRVFADPHALMEQDRVEGGEYRWQTIGLVDGLLLLLVAHSWTEYEDGTDVVRMISARRASAQERKRYEQNRASYF